MVLKWIENDSLLIGQSDGMGESSVIAAFDLDSTIIKVRSGQKFPKDKDDWDWWHESVPKKLKELWSENYKIVIFTNQGGIAKKKQKVEDLMDKLSEVCRILAIPIQCFMATADDIYRKPNTTMWDYMVTNYNCNYQIDMDNCIYVGDAAGRLKGWQKGRKKDFSCDDRKFAFNIGLPFLTPEEFFLSEKPTIQWEWLSIDPQQFLLSVKPFSPPAMISVPELVIFVGRPGSGKTTFYHKYFENLGYIWINRDTLKSAKKCLSQTSKALSSKSSLVIDNTNPDRITRQAYIDCAKKYGITIRCIYFDICPELAQHLNHYRQKITGQPKVPKIAFNLFKKKFQQPLLDEGFDSILTVTWQPDFPSPHHRTIFLQRT